MERFRNLGIYLNDEPGDREAVAFAGLLTRIGRPESIFCIHVRGIEDPATMTPAPEAETIRVLVEDALPPDASSRINIHISTATGMREMLRTAREHDLDMIVVGRRLPHDQLGAGSAFYRLARKSPCTVLVAPHGTHAHLSRLLVPVDGSEHSRLALETAIVMARASGESPNVVAQSVYSVQTGYGYVGMNFEEARRDREAATRKEIEPFLDKIDTSDVHFEVVYTCSGDTAAAAHDLASAKNMDAIVIGSRGATAPAVALLGVNTERVLVNAPLPVIVVKRKGETFRFLDALMANFQEPV